jgi:hypothetical protein
MRWSSKGGHSRPRGLPQNVRLLLPLHGAGGPPLGRRIGFGTENSNEGAGINRGSVGPLIVGPLWWQQKEKQMSRDVVDSVAQRRTPFNPAAA